METHLHPRYQNTTQGQAADRILRACVHCGFCTATCPTYQELGDELDGPRGRIYQIKNVLEGQAPDRQIQQHLDRCLSCLNCMTTCPSGVEYDKLLGIGREEVEAQVKRPVFEKWTRWLLRQVIPYPKRFSRLMAVARLVKPVLPAVLKSKIPLSQPGAAIPQQDRHPRKVILHQGCVQPALTPATDAATGRILDRAGISVIVDKDAACCGAVSHHLSATEEAKQFIRKKIDQWWPSIESGAEAIIVTASGCGVMVKDYGHIMADDPDYADKAKRVSKLTRDLVEILSATDLEPLMGNTTTRIAFHPPCTLQHGQKLAGRVEALLTTTGFELTPIQDVHSCCGSAGTYSILQAELSDRLRSKKITALEAGKPKLIATANVGCQTHLAAKTAVPVIHWIELYDPESEWNRSNSD